MRSWMPWSHCAAWSPRPQLASRGVAVCRGKALFFLTPGPSLHVRIDGDAGASHSLAGAKTKVIVSKVGAEREAHMFPYRDENETQRTAIVTMTLIGLNVLIWLVVQGAGATLPLARSVCELGLI